MGQRDRERESGTARSAGLALAAALLLLALAAAGCGDSDQAGVPGPAAAPRSIPGVQVRFDLEGERFFDMPFPTDLRRRSGPPGGLDLSGYPRPGLSLTRDLQTRYIQLAARADGFGRSTTIYFAFDDPIGPSNLPVHPMDAAAPGSPVFLVDVDPGSPERGRRFPLRVRYYRRAGSFHPENLLALTPLPGFVLRPATQYAAIVLRSIGDEDGAPLGSPLPLQQLLHGLRPPAARGDAATEAFRNLVDFLADEAISPAAVAAATPFTTSDPVRDTARVYNHVISLAPPSLSSALERTREYETYYALEAAYPAPQFQRGTHPFLPDGGDIVFDADDRPVQQGVADVPICLAIPKGSMPAEGWPLMIYIHGTGGVSTQMLDRGKQPAPDEAPPEGSGPASTFAARGIATAGSALPVNPQRGSIPGLDGYDYYQVLQPPATRDNLRQSVAEQAVYLRLLKNLTIDPSLCPQTDASLAPDGRIRFDGSHIFAMGQSLGSIVLDIWAAYEENLAAIIPSGTAAHFGTIALEMRTLPLSDILRVLLGLDENEELDAFHPFINALMLAWDAADPINFVGHHVRDPLSGRAAKHVFLSQGFFDHYFPPPGQNAFILASGLQLSGKPYDEATFDRIAEDNAYDSPRCGIEAPCSRSTVEVMDLLGLGIEDYPVSGNLTAGDGSRVTGVVVQAFEDGILDGHHVNFQRDVLKYQYGCFLRTFLDTGTPTLLPPGDPGADCDGTGF